MIELWHFSQENTFEKCIARGSPTTPAHHVAKSCISPWECWQMTLRVVWCVGQVRRIDAKVCHLTLAWNCPDSHMYGKLCKLQGFSIYSYTMDLQLFQSHSFEFLAFNVFRPYLTADDALWYGGTLRVVERICFLVDHGFGWNMW